MSSITRRQARETAFQFLYGALPAPKAEAVSFKRNDFWSFCESFGYGTDEFAWELVEGTGKKLPEIDEQISQLSTNWRIERMPKVDLALLRLGAYEIFYRADIPKTVAINEAIELAKKFGAEETASFINGILDKFTKPDL